MHICGLSFLPFSYSYSLDMPIHVQNGPQVKTALCLKTLWKQVKYCISVWTFCYVMRWEWYMFYVCYPRLWLMGDHARKLLPAGSDRHLEGFSPACLSIIHIVAGYPLICPSADSIPASPLIKPFVVSRSMVFRAVGSLFIFIYFCASCRVEGGGEKIRIFINSTLSRQKRSDRCVFYL